MTATSTEPSRRDVRRPRRGGVGNAILGVVGELLITLGLVLGLFVVWQLWWTDVEADQIQAELSQEFDRELTQSPAIVGTPQTDAPPVDLAPLDATTFARLWVPRWGTDGDPYVRTISEGVDRATVLDVLGIGHYPDTAMPGEVGNFAIAGHRQSHGKPFYAIDQLQEGDALIVETATAWYTYRVTSSQIVLPSEVSVIAPNPINPSEPAVQPMITLTTCHPLFSTKERYVVHGVLESWIPRESGMPAELVTAEEGS